MAVKMSIEALTIVLNHSKASGAVKLVLMGIANHINPDNDGAWPSQPKLAHYANCSDRYVRDAIQELVKLGELAVESHGGRGKADNYKPNRYWLLLTCPPDCDRTTNHRTRGELSAVQGGTLSQTGGNSTSAEPLENPNKEPLVKPVTTKPKKPMKSLEADWTPSDDLVMAFADKWPSLKYRIELEAFVNYHLARDSKMANWDAAFRNWCANAVKWAEEKKPKTSVDYNKIKGYK